MGTGTGIHRRTDQQREERMSITDIVGHTADAPPPAGPYSQSRRLGDLIACSGQAGYRPDGGIDADFGSQLHQTFRNLRHTARAAGADLGTTLQVRIFLTDPGQFAQMNEIYRQYFAEPFPARTTVTVTLPPPLLVEADLLAVALSADPGEKP